MYWFIKNAFKIGEETVQEELLFRGEYSPQYYKARRQYDDKKKRQWTKNWLSMKVANGRVLVISAELTQNDEITEQELTAIEGE